MHVTILSGRVATENWMRLEESFEKISKNPPQGVITSILVQCNHEPKLWQIITTWESVSEFEHARGKELISICENLFCNAGSVPYRNEFTVLGKYTRV